MNFKCDFKKLGPYTSLLCVILLLGFDAAPSVNFHLPPSQGSLGPLRSAPFTENSHPLHKYIEAETLF